MTGSRRGIPARRILSCWPISLTPRTSCRRTAQNRHRDGDLGGEGGGTRETRTRTRRTLAPDRSDAALGESARCTGEPLSLAGYFSAVRAVGAATRPSLARFPVPAASVPFRRRPGRRSGRQSPDGSPSVMEVERTQLPLTARNTRPCRWWFGVAPGVGGPPIGHG